MKILVLSSLAYSLTNFRGALLRAMRSNGHEVIAVAPDDNEDVRAELEASGISFRVVPMQRAGTNPFHDTALLYRYLMLIARERPDLVLAYTQKPIIYGGLAARFMCVPRYFALMSGLGHVFSPGNDTNRLFRSFVGRMYREAVRRARAIFVFNSDDRKDMLELGIISAEQPVIQVPGSGVDLERFTAQPLPRQQISFLLVARLMRDKGIYEFLEAAKRISIDHPECSFQVLGHFDTENPTGLTREECERLSRHYPVRFIPGTSDVRPYLGAASVFVLPSCYREGLPRTILEAMATGRAVITTDMPGCRDPIEENGNGFLVPPRNADALAAAMARFVDDPSLIVRMGSRSRELAERVYDVRLVNRFLLNEMELIAPETYKGQGAGDYSMEDMKAAPAQADGESTAADRVRATG
ncbi:MAG: glycosyltransferase family 4 protein [Sphingomonadaceae bacterium]